MIGRPEWIENSLLGNNARFTSDGESRHNHDKKAVLFLLVDMSDQETSLPQAIALGGNIYCQKRPH